MVLGWPLWFSIGARFDGIWASYFEMHNWQYFAYLIWRHVCRFCLFWRIHVPSILCIMKRKIYMYKNIFALPLGWNGKLTSILQVYDDEIKFLELFCGFYKSVKQTCHHTIFVAGYPRVPSWGPWIDSSFWSLV